MRERKIGKKVLVFGTLFLLVFVLFGLMLLGSAVAQGSEIRGSGIGTGASAAELQLGSYVDQKQGTAPAYVAGNSEYFHVSPNFISEAAMGNMTLVFLIILLVAIFIATFVCSKFKKKQNRFKKVLRFYLVVIMIIAVFAVMPMNVSAEPGTINVPGDYTKIQDAIDNASSGDTVQVAAGTYSPSTTGEKFPIQMKNSVSLVGEGADVCIIDAEQTNRVIYCSKISDPTTRIEGFTITNGKYHTMGAGILCSDSSPLIINNIIKGNKAGESGGGIMCWYHSSPIIDSNVIIGNSAYVHGYASGGGICAARLYGNPTIINNVITENSANYSGGGITVHQSWNKVIDNNLITWNTTGGLGGGIECFNGYGTISNNIITDNTSGSSGGGISHHYYAKAKITNNTIIGNTAGGSGGGINSSSGSSPTITNNIINDNTAGANGGGVTLYQDSYGATLTDNEICRNTADGLGGGVVCGYVQQPSNIAGNTIIDNTARQGGGICVDNRCRTSLNITDNIIDGNRGNLNGGGIFITYKSSPNITLNVITNNSASNLGGGIYAYDSNPIISKNEITDNSADNKGGGISCYRYSKPVITQNNIGGNSAGNSGGGIHAEYWLGPIITNNLIIENYAGSVGGGISCYNRGGPTLTNNDIVGNSAGDRGGAVYTGSNSGNYWYNNIITDNSSPNGGAIHAIYPTDLLIRYCDVWNNSPQNYYGIGPSSGTISADPMFVNPSAGDYHLQASSPCVDKGYNKARYIPSVDFDDGPRILDGNDDGIAVVDMGVYEGPGNQPPIADDQSVTTDEDTAIAITLSASDPNNDDLTYDVVDYPLLGTLSGMAPNLIYTPNENIYGSDSFTFKANDGTLDSNIATVSITIGPVNDPPVADDQGVTTNEDTPVSITLQASDIDGDILIYIIVAYPSNGTLSSTPPGLTYTPNSDYYGSDSFTFKANDGGLNSNTATVTITINPVNDAPAADDQAVTTDEDTAVDITLTANDVDGDPLTYIIVAEPSFGTLIGTGANLIYSPNADIYGSDSFTFKVNDGELDSNLATVSITVNPVNDAPIAHDQTVTTDEDTVLSMTLIASDIDSDILTYSIVGYPSHGTLMGTLPNIIYTPDENYYGSDSFTFKVNDGEVDSNIAIVDITINPVNDVPVVSDIVDQTIYEGDVFTASGSFTDPDLDIWTATVDYDDGSGIQTLELNPDKTFNLDHLYVDDYYFPYTVIVTVSDNNGGIGSELIAVTVYNVAPTITSLDGPIDPVNINDPVEITGSFTDPGMLDTHTAIFDWGDTTSTECHLSNGERTITGSHTYTEAGVYTISLEIIDDDGDSDTATYSKYVVVYDPDSGFVTGGGWINSPAGAYVADPEYPEGMVSYWKLDEGSGTTASDSADANDGTLYSPNWTDGKVDGALSFDGNSHVAIPDSPSLKSPTTALSIEAWVNLHDTSFEHIVAKQYEGVGLPYQYQYDSYVMWAGGGYLWFSVCDGNDQPRVSTQIDTNVWHHVVGVWDGSTSTMQLYIDGQLQASDTFPGFNNIVYDDSPCLIGADDNSSVGILDGFLNGIVDEVAIYSQALSAEEIEQHYNNGLEGREYYYVALLEGKANFGFVSKYKKGAEVPTGNTEFQFKAGNLNFHSSTYQWLVVAGHKAQFKGTGTINGAGNYGFMLTAIDEKLTPSTDVDIFRIKIWDMDNNDSIVYDNQMGDADNSDPTCAISGGSIVIHKG